MDATHTHTHARTHACTMYAHAHTRMHARTHTQTGHVVGLYRYHTLHPIPMSIDTDFLHWDTVHYSGALG